jgi:hypothetical protein
MTRQEHDHSLIGLWHIYEMEMWDEDYFNMEVQTYIEITLPMAVNFSSD